ncbi:VirB4 family type IV secretion/conjugal transfer ATPase [Bordetella sp. FB-8]|uniref:VirB4 family type IV secretion/conjugal transfer ATPase n=1 Tax=Bordetella sp. FB-8 TaxID=1159870 RepID=UPI0004777625|nr:VirB4 family type IV secretion/conjugal transfer ATPase [Bordetella sp. FB-8]
MKAAARAVERPRSEPSVSEHVPYSHHVTPTIMATKTGEYLSVWKLGGRSFEGISQEELSGWRDELNNMLRGFPNGFGLYTHLVRRRVREYPESDYPDWFSSEYDKTYRRGFDNTPPLVNDLYLTIVVRLSIDSAMKVFSRFEKRSAQDVALWQARAIEQLDDINRKVASGLRRYDPELLSIVERRRPRPGSNLTQAQIDNAIEPVDPELVSVGHFSEAAEFFGFLINGQHEAAPLVSSRFCDCLPSARPFFSMHGELAALRHPRGTRRFAMVEIREYPESTKPGHLNNLLKLPFEFILTQSFGAMSKADGRAALVRQRRWLVDSGDDSKKQVAELDLALDDLAAGKFIMGDHHCTLAVFGDTNEVVMRNAADAITELAECEIVGRTVDRASVAAFRAQLPCNWIWRPRPAAITSLNFLSFSSLQNYLFGKPDGNPWGPAVTLLKTASATPYYLNFHASLEDQDETGKRMLGNTFFIGKSGTGKTAALGHVLTQARKFRMTAAVFDKDQGMRSTVRALGGVYFALQMAAPTGWSPLQMEPTPRNLTFMKRLIVQLASRGEKEASLKDQRDISTAVDRLTQMIDRQDRGISTLIQFLPAAPSLEADELSLHDRLQRWSRGHELGWVFDNPSDHMDLAQYGVDLFGFDLTEFLEDGPIRDAGLMYLIYRTEGLIDGRRFMYMFDEVQHPLKVPYFQDMMRNKARVIRKQNGIFVFATQEPAAILENPVGRTLIQQTATALYLPNPDGTEAEYIDGFKLTPAIFKMIKELGEFSRQFVVKQGQSAVTAGLDLSHCPEALLVFSGSEDTALVAEQCIALRGDKPQDWLPMYYERVRALGKK